MAQERDLEMRYAPMSIAELQLLSGIGAVERWNGWSMTDFVPLRDFNPNSATDAERGRVLATLIMDIFKPR